MIRLEMKCYNRILFKKQQKIAKIRQVKKYYLRTKAKLESKPSLPIPLP